MYVCECVVSGHVCIHVWTCIFLAVMMKLGASGTPSPRDTGVYTHTHTLFLSLSISYFGLSKTHMHPPTNVEPAHTHTHIYMTHVDVCNHICAHSAIAGTKHA